MHLFGRARPSPDLEPELVRLNQRVSAVESTLRQLELEQQSVHDQVRRWMRRAVQAEQRDRARGAESGSAAAPQGVGASSAVETPVPRASLWGARARIAARRARALAPASNGSAGDAGEGEE